MTTVGTAMKIDMETGLSTVVAALPFLGKDGGMTFDPRTNRVWVTAGGGINEYDPTQFVPGEFGVPDVDPVRSFFPGSTLTCIACIPAAP